MALIELTEVSLSVDKPAPVQILHPLDLSIEQGSSLSIVGPSGAGKSSLASVIGLLQHPTSGVYRFDGHEVGTLGSRQAAQFRAANIGFVFQSAHLIDERTALENILLGLVTPTADGHERAHDALQSVGLGGLGDRRAALMSGGERQRIAIARAMVKRPKLLIADEPTGALDQSTGFAVLELLYGLQQSGITVVVVTHNQAVADAADRTSEIIDGYFTVTER